MKYKNINCLVISGLIFISLICFSACNNINKETVCEHTYIFETVKADWHNKGGFKYTCSKCGKVKYDYNSDNWSDRCRETCNNVFEWQIKSRLKDPDSVRYSSKIYVFDLCKDGEINYRLTYVFTYNAKNSFGGYVGYVTEAYGGYFDGERATCTLNKISGFSESNIKYSFIISN